MMTKSLRQHDIGVIAAGAVFGITVPPSVKDTTTSVFCTADCTKEVCSC